MPNVIPHRRRAGFTLVELLIVTAVSALIAMAMAHGLFMFGRALESVRADADKGPEEAVALMTDMARYGWSVEQPAASQLDVVDALGEKTSFALVDDDLLVTRPSGVTGELLSGVASMDIQTDTLRRLREAEPVDDFRTWFAVPSADSSTPIILESGLPVALGFTMGSSLPDSYDVVDGVDEHPLFAALETLGLSLAFVDNAPPDPNEPISGGTGSGHGSKVDICHIPPGNPDNAHTLTVSINAVDAHLEHGDVLGPCEPPPDTKSFPELTLQLFEARAPDDARPVGEALASMTMSCDSLPAGSASWEIQHPGKSTHFQHDHSAAQCAATTQSGMVVMSHVPPGNPAKAHSILVAPSAVAAHLAHGDYFGSCGAHDSVQNIYALVLKTETKPFDFDLSPLGAMILPGRAYTLVLTLAGPGMLYLESSSLGSSTNSGVAQAAAPYGELVAAAASVPFELDGMQRITQTEEHEPVSRVSVALETLDGQSVKGSASVTAQANVPGEWLGAVPGEVAEIDP